jgi:uncharacterized protein YbjT (DUF2867 family)
MPRNVFITEGTGFIGRPLITQLVCRGHAVRALVRSGSESRLPSGATAVSGNPLDASYASAIPPADTFVHLVGVSHPNPSKASEFRSIDAASAKVAIGVARAAGVSHFVYLSVAQPAPVMQAYIAARAECEAALRASGLNATMVRPWYVLCPGRRWPYLLLPIYWVMNLLPKKTRDGARRLWPGHHSLHDGGARYSG